MRISDWSSDVCSSDLGSPLARRSPKSVAGLRLRASTRRAGFRTRPAGRGDFSDRRRRAARPSCRYALDRKSVVSGKSVSVRVDLGGRRIIKKKKQQLDYITQTHKYK